MLICNNGLVKKESEKVFNTENFVKKAKKHR